MIKLNKLSKNIFYIIVLALICFVFASPLLRQGFYRSHDGEPQLARIASFYSALSDGQIPPRWSSNLNYTYGSPALIFFFPMEGYLGSLVHYIGFNFQDTYKILMVLSFVLAPIFFYFWLSEIFKRDTAFIGALFYGLAPYHFLDSYVRGHLAESMAFVFIPLIFLLIEKNRKKVKIVYILLGGISYGCLILSHSIVSLSFSPILLAYAVLRNWGSKNRIMSCMGIFLIGLGIASFFWIPALFEGKYINSHIFAGDVYKSNFTNIVSLFYSEWGFGDKVNSLGGLSPQIGPIHILLSLLSLQYFFLKQKEKRIQIAFWLIILIGCIFMSIKASSFVWENIHFIQQFQFPWRFTAVSSFAASVLSTYYIFLINKRYIKILLVIFLLFISLNFAKVNGYIDKNDSFYSNYEGTAAYHGEATTVWTAGDATSFPDFKIEVIAGRASLSKVVSKSNLHQFTVNAKSNVSILDNTVYFPGWQVLIDKQKVPIEFQDINHRGFITFNVPEGKHNVEVVFGESPIRMISDLISLFSLIGIILIIAFRKRINLIK